MSITQDSIAIRELSPQPAEKAHQSVGDFLREIVVKPGDHWTIGELGASLSDRGFGIMLLAFSLPNMIPIPIPGTSIVTSIPLLFIAVQILIGRKKVWLPGWLGSKRISRDSFKKMVEWLMPYLIKMERVTKPRLYTLVSPLSERLAGVVATFLGVLIALPIPFGNFMPGVALGLIALAIVQRDGRLMAIGWGFSAIAAIFVVFLANGYAWLFLQVLEKIV